MFYDPFVEDEYEWLGDNEDSYERGESFNLHEYQLSETLVIHPADRTTDFLSAIYRGKGWDVVNDPFAGRDVIAELIDTHERIICLGHGSPLGLFGGSGFLIHDGLAPLFRNKHMVAIWCNADQFMNKHGFSGFFTGMFISELDEARLFGIDDTDEETIESSNNLFASTLGKNIDSENILENVKRGYQDENDSVIKFNRVRLYCNTEDDVNE